MIQSNPELNIEARAIFELLEKAKVGDVITYSDLNKLIGRNVQDGARASLEKARKRELKENGRLWEVVRNEGLKLASDSEIAQGVTEDTRKRLQGLAKRQGRKIAAIQDLNALPNEEKTAVLVAQSMVGAIVSITSSSGVKKITQKVINTEQAIPIGRMLEAFK